MEGLPKIFDPVIVELVLVYSNIKILQLEEYSNSFCPTCLQNLVSMFSHNQ